MRMAPGDLETMVPGLAISVSAGTEVLLNGSVKITAPDIGASNGYIQVIDEIIVPWLTFWPTFSPTFAPTAISVSSSSAQPSAQTIPEDGSTVLPTFWPTYAPTVTTLVPTNNPTPTKECLLCQFVFRRQFEMLVNHCTTNYCRDYTFNIKVCNEVDTSSNYGCGVYQEARDYRTFHLGSFDRFVDETDTSVTAIFLNGESTFCPESKKRFTNVKFIMNGCKDYSCDAYDIEVVENILCEYDITVTLSSQDQSRTLLPTFAPNFTKSPSPSALPLPTLWTSQPTFETPLPTVDATRPRTLAPILASATATPQSIATSAPTTAPTKQPSPEPTSNPTSTPTTTPTKQPSPEPTSNPTAAPTTQPTSNPTQTLTTEPTKQPSPAPTSDPTSVPTTQPTSNPTQTPSTEPTTQPTPEPTFSCWGTNTPCDPDACVENCCSGQFQEEVIYGGSAIYRCG
ncbi:hypothetical protein ACHAXM_004145 [Skeletonema potamos]